MVEYDSILSLSFLKKSRFTGSLKGMRYVLEYVDREGISMLKASVCPGPNSVDKTKAELFISEEFPFTEEGKKQSVDWINERYTEGMRLYDDIFQHPLHYFEKNHC